VGRPLRRGALVAMSALLLAVPASPAPAATAPPNVFSVRLQGWAVQSTASTTSTQEVPGFGFSFAKVNSTPSLDGGRDLDMAAIAANGQDDGLGGVVIFGGSIPTNGSNLPGYTEAFFPTFEGKSTVSEKCAANQTEAREAPECRDQPGPYAFSQVVPEESALSAIGTARNGGGPEGGDTSTTASVTPTEEGAIASLQRNTGRDLLVPGTPISVDSFLAEVRIVAATTGVTAESVCDATVSVGGQQVASNRELQQLLGPFSTSTGVTVEYRPPTEPVIEPTPDGGLQVSCRGPQFVVDAPVQGGTGATYTYGRTFGAAGKPAQRDGGGPVGDLGNPIGGPIGGPIGPPATGGNGSPTGVGLPSVSTPEVATPEVDDGGGSPTITPSSGGEQLVEKRLDTFPIAMWSAAAGTALPLAVWLLLGVTGSLARGSRRLRLPPFHDR
jgi:hypothetical protein